MKIKIFMDSVQAVGTFESHCLKQCFIVKQFIIKGVLLPVLCV